MGLAVPEKTDTTDSLGKGSKTMAGACWQKLHTQNARGLESKVSVG